MALVEYYNRERIGYVVLNRPEKSNALSPQLVSELKTAFKAAADDPVVKVIVLRAKGDVFCAGADLEYLQQLQQFSYEENLADSTHLKDLLLQIYRLNKVVIAEVQGHAIAGGCGLAMVCDFVLATPESKFGYTEVKIGFVPAIVMVFLLRRIAEGHARELLLSGKLINASTAADWGMVNRIVEKNILESEVNLLAAQLVKDASSQSLTMTKKMIAEVQHMRLEDALDFACRQNADARSKEDYKRGIAAFLEKQELKW